MNCFANPQPFTSCSTRALNSLNAAAESVLHDFVGSAPVGIFRARGDGRIVFSNSTLVRMLGFPSAEALRKLNAHDLCAASADSRIWLQEMACAGFVQNFVTRLNCYSGRFLWVELHARSVADECGNIVFFEGIAVDISLRKEVEESLVGLAANREEDDFEQTMQLVSRLMAERDPYTALHQRRVARLARSIASELRLPERQRRGVYLGALVHDVGKLFVPLDVLRRSGRLRKKEIELIRRHPCRGFEVFKNTPSRWPIPFMIQQHHERLDGSGYPRKLGRRDILLESRIIAVADTIDAISEHRPYRPGLGGDFALAEISSGRGTIYDEIVVDAAARVFLEQRYQASDESMSEQIIAIKPQTQFFCD